MSIAPPSSPRPHLGARRRSAVHLSLPTPSSPSSTQHHPLPSPTLPPYSPTLLPLPPTARLATSAPLAAAASIADRLLHASSRKLRRCPTHAAAMAASTNAEWHVDPRDAALPPLPLHVRILVLRALRWAAGVTSGIADRGLVDATLLGPRVLAMMVAQASEERRWGGRSADESSSEEERDSDEEEEDDDLSDAESSYAGCSSSEDEYESDSGSDCDMDVDSDADEDASARCGWPSSTAGHGHAATATAAVTIPLPSPPLAPLQHWKQHAAAASAFTSSSPHHLPSPPPSPPIDPRRSPAAAATSARLPR
ncbi:hypothetical protein H9P43_002067 [Blastocladiella emersonii ATCC 22665]|nr:hypothetical protein H9P43_002067 [Blastocladiella emersonii ATCC 22665]